MNQSNKSWCLVRLGTLALANKKVVSKDTECVTDQYGAWWRVGNSNVFRLEKECSAEFVVS